MKAETLKRITSGLRFRLTLSYALFSTLLLAGSGMIFIGLIAIMLFGALSAASMLSTLPISSQTEHDGRG
jgi:hypothetical protein